ncbi:MAG TPA: hypothetical protein VGN35_01780 [Jatrophihabitantaceae bacterium]|jgi:hypothetical protein|nr:hypothetical protein [Jatrophihabitantaceae bacterium]
MPLLFAGPSELHVTARRIRDHAVDLRHRAALLCASAENVHWRSPAADSFRARVSDVASRMRVAARDLELSADSLDRHARRVSHALASAEHAVVRAVEFVAL